MLSMKCVSRPRVVFIFVNHNGQIYEGALLCPLCQMVKFYCDTDFIYCDTVIC